MFFGYSVHRHGTLAVPQILDAGVVIAQRILTALCGHGFHASYVQFSHNQPDDTAPYRRLFRTKVRFGAEASGMVFQQHWCQKRIAGADAKNYQRIARMFPETGVSGALTFAERVEAAMPQIILSGMGTSRAVAQLFAVNERTLRRRLSADGTQLRTLINQSRFELAKQLLEDTSLSVATIAHTLGYEDPTAFPRAFQNWANSSPSQWRARN